MIKKILVIGGTGLIGRPVVEQLLADGFDVTIGSRSPGHVQDIFGNRFTAIPIDLTEPTTIPKAIADQDAIHVSLPSGPRFKDCFRTEYQGIINLMSNVGESNLKRISYLSGDSVTPDETFPPVRAKWLAEEPIRSGDIPYSIWRPTWFAETLTKLARFGTIAMIGKGEVGAHWLTGRDFGRWVSKSMNEPKADNQTFNPYGQEWLSMKEAVEIYRDICFPLRPIASSPIGMVSFIGKTLRNWDMWFGAEMFRFLESVGERGDPTTGNELFGKMSQTVEDFAREQAGI